MYSRNELLEKLSLWPVGEEELPGGEDDAFHLVHDQAGPAVGLLVVDTAKHNTSQTFRWTSCASIFG